MISNADPKRTLLKLVDPTQLSPDFVRKLQELSLPWGRSQRSTLRSRACPTFPALKSAGNGNALKGRIQIGHEIDYLERAFDESKYGNFSRNPYLEATIPISDRSVAGSRRASM